MKTNIILSSDSYKYGHYKMYLPGTEYVYSYMEPRVGAQYDETVMFGLQYFLKNYIEGAVVTEDSINEAERVINHHLGPGVFDRKMWEHILEQHGGKLPVKIYAVPEGTKVPAGNVILAITNTDPKCPEIVNFLETILLSLTWPGITVASKALHLRKKLEHYANITCGDTSCVDFQLHAFGARSTFGFEAQMLAGAAHLLCFKGTDFVSPFTFIEKYYNTKIENIEGYSVAATEHSIMTQCGKISLERKKEIRQGQCTVDNINEIDINTLEGEEAVFVNLLQKFPKGILSIVIDSYDSHFFVSELARYYKKQILARDGKLVFRPDSGNPVTESLEIVKRAEEVFGYSINEVGYKVLNPKVGVLYGDSINANSIVDILENLMRNHYASSNLILGMGTELTQNISRDSQKFAFKVSAIGRRIPRDDGMRNEIVWHGVCKDPITANIINDKTIDKRSKEGIQVLRYDERNKQYYTESHNINGYTELDIDLKYPDWGIMKKVFENGKVLIDYNYNIIKSRILKK